MIHAHRGDISGLVGAIYDCAYNRERWPDTLRQICQALDCVAGVLFSYGGSGDQVLFRLPCCEWGPGRIMVLSAVGMCRRMMVSEALAS
jgi:hypothetical protein